MASHVSLTTLLGYAAAFWCLDALPEAGKFQMPTSAFVLRLAAGAVLPAVLATFGLTSLLLFAHVRGAHAATGTAAAARRRRLLELLANATLAATAAALLAVAVLRLGADGYLGGGGGGGGWLWRSAE